LNTVKTSYHRIAVKIGSNVLSKADGSLNTDRIAHIVKQIAKLKQKGVEVVLITSGAVAAGRGEYNISKKTPEVASKQVWSAIGQVKLMSCYFSMFGKYNMQAAQVLTTRENFSDRRHYLNMKNCITAMLDNGIIPLVNENDTIAVTELMFTDNDELSGLISSMMGCQALFILSNVDGVYSGNPNEETSELISEIEANDKSIGKFIAPVKSGFGRGGMLTKCAIAQKIALQGIDVYISNGTRNNVLIDIFNKQEVPFTRFKANSKKTNSVKTWLAHSATFAKGKVFINEGAELALRGKTATSLLTVGIETVEGFFKKGDIVKVYNGKGEALGIGKSQYGSDDLKATLGKHGTKAFIHYDYLVLND